MELYEEIILRSYQQGIFAASEIDPKEIVAMTCYQALKDIQSILHDEWLDDKACFQKIEEIICVFEKIGSSGGFRHDFG